MSTTSLDLSLSNFNSLLDLNKFFEKVKESFNKEQKAISLHRRMRSSIDQPFNIKKFLFSSPDKV
jgi:hypothetical protein